MVHLKNICKIYCLKNYFPFSNHLFHFNSRPDYKWAYFANVIVYTYNRVDREDTTVVFWNSKTGDVSDVILNYDRMKRVRA